MSVQLTVKEPRVSTPPVSSVYADDAVNAAQDGPGEADLATSPATVGPSTFLAPVGIVHHKDCRSSRLHSSSGRLLAAGGDRGRARASALVGDLVGLGLAGGAAALEGSRVPLHTKYKPDLALPTYTLNWSPRSTPPLPSKPFTEIAVDDQET